jgi:hypothetical protein
MDRLFQVLKIQVYTDLRKDNMILSRLPQEREAYAAEFFCAYTLKDAF